MFLFEVVHTEFIYRLVRVALIVLVLLTLASQFGKYLYLELTTHFRLQYVLAAIVCAIVFTVFQSWKFVPIAVLCAILNALPLVPYLRSIPRGDTTGKTLRVLHANVLKDNKDYEGLLNLIRESNPDLVVLQEITAEWDDQLNGLKEVYPHFKSVPGLDGAGMAVFSRRALTEVEVLTLDDSTHVAIKSKVNVNGAALTLLSLHPPTPTTGRKFANRNRQFREAATLLKSISGPRILIGDLNTTMWSPYFTNLVNSSGLRDARTGFGLQTSWPMPLPSFLRLPIDHCLVSSEINVHALHLGSHIGSDHRPLIIELSF